MTSLTDVTAQQGIDMRISELEDAVRALKTQRNTHCAISKLPTEVISKIFVEGKNLICGSSNTFPVYPHGARRSDRSWLNVSGVCREWRDIVLNTPRFWSSIDLDPPDRALEMIKRSKSAPLRVWGRQYDRARLGKVAEVVMSQIDRVQELHLSAVDSESLLQFFRLNKDTSASLLEVLHLDSHPSVLPKDIFQRDMPCLRVLALVGGTFSTTLPYLPRLAELTVDPASAPGLPVDLLVQSLRNTPNLETIRISELISTAVDDCYSLPPVSLPRLSRLSVSTNEIGVSKVFDFIDYPKCTIVNFVCYEEFSLGLDLSSIKRVCSRSATARSTPILELSISTGPLFTISVMTEPPPSSPHLDISLPLPTPAALAMATEEYVELFSAFPLATIPSLILSGTVVPWAHSNLLPQFKQVKDLTLLDCTHEGIRALLKDKTTKRPPLQNLRKITMRKCQFNHTYEEWDGELCSAVKTLLAERKRMKMRIRKLVIECCDVSVDVVDDLKRLVEVEWDGIEIEDEDEDDFNEPDEDEDVDDFDEPDEDEYYENDLYEHGGYSS